MVLRPQGETSLLNGKPRRRGSDFGHVVKKQVREMQPKFRQTEGGRTLLVPGVRLCFLEKGIRAVEEF